MCPKNTGSERFVSQYEKRGIQKHYERFGKWKHGLQRHLNGKKKFKKED
jgi:hypothetical protein